MSENKYQPLVIKCTEELISRLKESGFFIDFEITNDNFAREYLLEKMTYKFIDGVLSEDFDDFGITEPEMDIYLSEIVSGTILYGLKEKGYVESYSDDSTEEVFFLTEKGKEYAKSMGRDKLF